MLILTRRLDQGIVIEGIGEVHVVVLGIERDRVKLGVEAPKEVVVLRDELAARCDQEGKQK